MKALPWIVAVVLIAVMAWTNPTAYDHLEVLGQNFQVSDAMELNYAILGFSPDVLSAAVASAPAAWRTSPMTMTTMGEMSEMAKPKTNPYQSYLLFSTTTSKGAIKTVGVLGRVFILAHEPRN